MPGRPQSVTDALVVLRELQAELSRHPAAAETHRKLTEVITALEGDNIVWGS